MGLVDVWRGRGGEFQETARGVMGIRVDVEVFVIANGRCIGWEETGDLEDGKVLEVMCRMNG